MQRRLGPRDRALLGRVIADSYEVGPQTGAMTSRPRFQDTARHDPTPWLPVLTGPCRRLGRAIEPFPVGFCVARSADRFASDTSAACATPAGNTALSLWTEITAALDFPPSSSNTAARATAIGGEVWVGQIQRRATCAPACRWRPSTASGCVRRNVHGRAAVRQHPRARQNDSAISRFARASTILC